MKKIKTLSESKKEHLQTILEKTAWDVNKTAQLLKIPLKEVLQMMAEYGIEKPE